MRRNGRGIVAPSLMGVCTVVILATYFFGPGPTPGNGSTVGILGAIAGPSDSLHEASLPRSFNTAIREFENRRVTGEPFSAQLTIETIQRLPDQPDRPVTMNYLIARDPEGRVRREDQSETHSNSAEITKSKMVFINDFVAGLNYVLEPQRQFGTVSPLKSGGDKNVNAVDINSPRPKTDNRDQTLPQGDLSKMAGADLVRAGNPRPVTTSLGRRDLEGLEVEGTKVTTTNPVGALGNSKKIIIVEERWYSPELETMVLIKHFDPRFGDSSYRLSSISRNQPSAQLFVIPTEYKTNK